MFKISQTFKSCPLSLEYIYLWAWLHVILIYKQNRIQKDELYNNTKTKKEEKNQHQQHTTYNIILVWWFVFSFVLSFEYYYILGMILYTTPKAFKYTNVLYTNEVKT